MDLILKTGCKISLSRPHLGVSVLALASPSLGTLKQNQEDTVTPTVSVNTGSPTRHQHYPHDHWTQREGGVRHHARKESTVLGFRVQHKMR